MELEGHWSEPLVSISKQLIQKELIYALISHAAGNAIPKVGTTETNWKRLKFKDTEVRDEEVRF